MKFEIHAADYEAKNAVINVDMEALGTLRLAVLMAKIHSEMELRDFEGNQKVIEIIERDLIKFETLLKEFII